MTDFDELAENFEFLEDWEQRYGYVIELGKAMPPMPDALKTRANKVDGCVSQVWIAPSREGDRLHFTGDSDALIVRGLVAILHTLYDGRTGDEILAIDAAKQLGRLGLEDALSPQRSNGLKAMVKRLRSLAAAMGAPAPAKT
jgi:cysteine desulfuration protein SufE